MAERTMPKYPVYIPSKSRFQHERALTARFLARDGVPFFLVVESHQVDDYRRLCDQIGVPDEWVLDVGFSDLGEGSIPARNWIADHAHDGGHARQWQLDDNSYGCYRAYKNDRIPVDAGIALRVCEDFTDRYDNIAISGLNYHMFGVHIKKPYYHNVHVYSCSLVADAPGLRWRGPYNEDTDLCLQALAAGWCTVLLNAFLIFKMKAFATNSGTGKRSTLGGNSEIYEGDGRLKMARCLERRWPGVVRVDRRFQRPQHIVNWRKFDTPLRYRPDFDPSKVPAVDEYGMSLVEQNPVNSAKVKQMIDEYARLYT